MRRTRRFQPSFEYMALRIAPSSTGVADTTPVDTSTPDSASTTAVDPTSGAADSGDGDTGLLIISPSSSGLSTSTLC